MKREIYEMRLPMLPYSSDGTLAGAIPGQRAFAALVNATPSFSRPEVCFLDFTGIDVATASFLRESIYAYKNHIRSHMPNLYPVAANMSDQALEEFDSFLKLRGDAFIICTLDQQQVASDACLIGQLDGKQLNALQEVLARGETDAPTLARTATSNDVAPTAWNNRLSALTAKGILMEITIGRGKRYRPVLEGLQHGS
jgi:hypothetical protein